MRLLRSGMMYLSIVILSGTAGQADAAERYRPDILIVKLNPESAQKVGRTRGVTATGLTSFDQLNTANAAVRLVRTVPNAIPVAQGGTDYYGVSRFYTIEFLPGADMTAVRASYAADPNVEVAEFDYIMPLYGAPNDADYGEQWTHKHVLDHDIDTEEAWDLEVGDSTVLVGIIDSGWLYGHPDLKAATWVNPGEDLDGDGVVFDADDIDGIDNDSNGYVDDLIGYDFLSALGGCATEEDCNGQDNDPVDYNGHGTHVGGIVAATTDNGIGVAGVAGGFRGDRRPGVKIMALRAGYEALDGNGFVNMAACAEAAMYAIDNGASVINCSWGSSGLLIHTAMQNVVANGIVVCKSAGNDGGEANEETPDIIDTTFGVLAIAALESLGGKAGFSSFGTWVDISAPGALIYNTYGSNGNVSYATLSGTSMSSPTVAGVAALLKSHHPWFTKIEIDSIMLATADNIDAFIPAYLGKMGAGRLNALSALSGLTTANFDADTTFGEAPWTVNFTDNSPNDPDSPYRYTFGDGDSAGTQNASHIYTNPGIFSVEYTASGPTGPHTRKRPEMIVVVRDTIEYGSVELGVGEIGSIPIRLVNTHPMKEITLPISLSGSPNVKIDSMQLTALTAGWSNTIIFNNLFFGQGVWQLRAPLNAAHLPAGNGVVANLWVKVNSGNPGDVETANSATLDGQELGLASNFVAFKPDFVPGEISVTLGPCDCSCHGDPFCDGPTDVFDVLGAVSIAFQNGTPITDPNCTHIGRSDANCNCVIDVFDVLAFVARAFQNNTDPLCNACNDPCP